MNKNNRIIIGPVAS